MLNIMVTENWKTERRVGKVGREKKYKIKPKLTGGHREDCEGENIRADTDE